MFRKRPVVVEAARWPEDAARWPAGWPKIGEHPFYFGGALTGEAGLMIDTLEGRMNAGRGDWIIKGVKGEFYPCKPDIFAATYEPVTGETNSGLTDSSTFEGRAAEINRRALAAPPTPTLRELVEEARQILGALCAHPPGLHTAAECEWAAKATAILPVLDDALATPSPACSCGKPAGDKWSHAGECPEFWRDTGYLIPAPPTLRQEQGQQEAGETPAPHICSASSREDK